MGYRPGRGRYLREDEDDADALADVLQGHRERVDDAEVRERGDDCREEQRRQIDDVHADEGQTGTDDDRLQRHENGVEQEAPR